MRKEYALAIVRNPWGREAIDRREAARVLCEIVEQQDKRIAELETKLAKFDGVKPPDVK